MKTRTKILNKAGVLLIAAFMVLSILPAVTADTSDFKDAASIFEQAKGNKTPHFPVGMPIPIVMNMETSETLSGGGGMFAPTWISYNDGSTESSLGLTSGGKITMAIELTTMELAGFYGQQITDIKFAAGSDAQGPTAEVDYQIWIDTSLPAVSGLYDGTTVTYYKEDTTDETITWQNVVLDTEFDIPMAGSVFVGVNYIDHVAGEYPCGMDDSASSPTRAALLTYEGSSWTDLPAAGFNYIWGLDVGVSAAGPGPGEDCIEDACDFAIDGFTDEFLAMGVPVDINGDGIIDYYAWNSNPHEICIKIANKGDIGIGELKLLADVFEKVCGPTIIIFDDPKYDIQQFPCCGSDYPFEFPGSSYTPISDEPLDPWTISDDDDRDSWCLQGGDENRWLTNNQAWRCTKGEDRSFGVDEDVYLGKSDASPGKKHDNLTTPAFDLSGVACATLSFSHWCEGEYTTDEDGNIIPADYGTIAYSLDDGANWIGVPASKFLAYDNDWQDVTIKFINTEIDAGDADYMHPYNMVCDDCQPGEDDIVVMDNLTGATLKVRFVWQKDPCLQYEGWYIDNVQVSKTLDYELELTCQTHEIIELEPCDAEVGVVWEDYCFPLPCEFEDDTWYEVHIVGQVFAPVGCEADLDNNEFKFQFKIVDLHDVKCVSMEATSATDVVPGDSVSVNVTVKNVGTYAEEDIPVSLQVGNLIKTEVANDGFETDSLGDYSMYYFRMPTCDTLVPWRWTKGDSGVSEIYDVDKCQARSRNPGDESIICAEQGILPYLMEDTMTILAIGETVDLDPNKNWLASGEQSDCEDPCGAELSFDMKYSLDMAEDTYYGGYYPGTLGSLAMLALMPAEGPMSGWVLGVNIIDDSDGNGYENDWVHVEFDNLAKTIWNRVKAYGYDYVPECEIGLWIIADGSCVDMLPADGNGGCTNPFNPVPWTGFMFDELYLGVVAADVTTKEVGSVIISELAQDAEETVQMSWTAELCRHVLQAETQLEGDMNPANDRCCQVIVSATQEERCFDSYIEDMTGGGPCLWHACTNREGGDDYFAWAGEETEHSGQYVNNMDQGLVSPTIDLSYSTFDLFAVNFSTWYKFSDADFGEVDIWKTYDHDGDPETASLTNWVQIGKVTGTTDGAFETKSFIVDPTEMENERTKIRFRMYSNGEGVSEGWYVDDVRIVNCTGTFADDFIGYNDGHTENAYKWTSGAAWQEAIELTDAKLSGFRDYDITDVRFSCGCDDYGFFAEDYEVWISDTFEDPTAPPMIYASGTATGTGWDTVPLTTAYEIPDSGHVYVGLTYLTSAGYPGGIDYSTHVVEGYWLYYSGSWQDGVAVGLPSAVWGLDAGVSMGAAGVEYLEDMPVLTWMDDQDDIDGYPSDLVELPDYPYINMEGIGSNYPCWDTFERGVLAPWTCEPGEGGQYWMHWYDLTDTSTLPNGASDYYHDICFDCDPGWYTIPSEKLVPWGYNAEGTGMNDAIAFELDLTGETLNQQYIKFCCAMNYDFIKEKAYIEFSPDWEPGTPMESATWTVYWCHTPGDNYGDSTGGWKVLDDFTTFDDDDRWVIEEYAGEKVYVRFRLETDGSNAAIGEGWALDDIHLKVKHTEIGDVDDEAPQTSIYFDEVTAKVTLVAQDFPIGKAVGVKATYYKIDGGEQQSGIEFTLDEGTHTIEYWSVDNNDNIESHKTATFTVDTTAPTIELTSPEEGKLYILGNPVMKRLLSSKTLCIGKVPIVADATDEGSGVSLVIFTLSNGDSGIDNDGAPYDYTFRGMHFGELTISAVAMDGSGLMSSADEITITCYSLGLL